MPLTKYDDMIKALSPKGPDHALAKRILPRTLACCSDLFHTDRSQTISEIMAVDGISVSQQILRMDLLLRKGLLYLLPSPIRRWPRRNSKVDDAPSFVRQNNENEEPLERDGWYHKEIARQRVLEVILEKRPPALRRRVILFSWHVLGNGRFGHMVAEKEKLGSNSRRSPGEVLSRHAADELDGVTVDRWAPSLRSRPPSPIEPPAEGVPRDDCLGLHQVNRFVVLVGDAQFLG